MNWNEMKRKAVEHGFKFVKHGARHDTYFHPETKQVIHSNDIGHKKSGRD